jgi:hypothetical protein
MLRLAFERGIDKLAEVRLRVLQLPGSVHASWSGELVRL